MKLDLNEPSSRIDLAIGSVLGISALMNSGDGPTNGFAYYFGVKNKIPHGIAGGIFLKEVMLYNYNKGFLNYGQLIDGETQKTIIEKNESLFSELDLLYNKLKIPNLSDYGYTISDIPILAEEASQALSGSFTGNPIHFNKNSAIDVLTKLL